MNRFAILGSGFGLYGYLPALASLGIKIILPERYQVRFASRPELASLAAQVEWLPDEYAAIDAASGIVLALQPGQQANWLPLCLAKKNINHFLLEKPLAKTPQDAYALLSQLTDAQKNFRIGYLFRYTSWGKNLLADFKNQSAYTQLSIHWHFMAHHFQYQINTWKRAHSAGGSVLRFYGIHLLALLAELGYEYVTSSTLFGKTSDEYDRWEASFTGLGLPPCNISIDTCAAKPLFHVKQMIDVQVISEAILSDPFADEYGMLDRRVGLLRELCESLFASSQNMLDYYHSTLMLWQQVENRLTNEEILYD